MQSSKSPSFPEFEQVLGLKTVGDWIRFSASQMERNGCYYGHGFASPWQESRFLILRGLSLDWDVPEIAEHAALIPQEQEVLYTLIKSRCIEKIPTAYLLEESWFCSEPFRITPSVLIPRSPIAELINEGFQPWLQEPPSEMLDMCTGSGCIGIAMARAFPEAHVDISDISEEALSIAVENISSKDLGYQVDAYLSDLFESLPDKKYDLIVTNPPYVDVEDLDDMPQEFSHEPRLGLAAGEDGLDLVRDILARAPDYLTEHGCLVGEVGNSAVALMDAFPEVDFHWPEFASGGHGVFVIEAAELRKHHSLFESRRCR
ncbi:50S ribosomal protein L3 N(5)-glutamine methyltransferase [Reinekea marinisedimentorum]|nr:50S ribosomal protein L3 N(5)-glutamine methyltransferase [Reinekea marinisedimentorum]